MGEKLGKVSNGGFWVSQMISGLAITHDLTGQELIREKVSSGEMSLGPIGRFLNENFVGDVGNAYAAIFLPPVICELINLQIQKSEAVQKWQKDVSRVITTLSPYLMTALFLVIAHKIEMSATNIYGAGTSDSTDFIGALWGAVTALPAVVRFNNKVFHSE